MSSTALSEKPTPSYEAELTAFATRLLARREAEKYAPWHPKNVLLHPRKICKLAFGLMSDEEMEKVLAHMDDSGTAGSKDKPNRPPKPDKKELKFWGIRGD